MICSKGDDESDAKNRLVIRDTSTGVSPGPTVPLGVVCSANALFRPTMAQIDLRLVHGRKSNEWSEQTTSSTRSYQGGRPIPFGSSQWRPCHWMHHGHVSARVPTCPQQATEQAIASYYCCFARPKAPKNLVIMPKEQFRPIAVKPPSERLWLFRLRCLVDLQLGTIVKRLRPELQALDGQILDVGAGESPWREWLSATASYRGIDVGNASEFGMRPDRKDITYYDGGVIPFADAAFDGAICIEVLEHAENPELCLSEIARILKDRAPLLISVPWSARRHHIPHDHHRFTRERLQILLDRGGFVDIEISERGNDIGAIASKLIVLTVRLIPKRVSLSALWTIPLAIVCAPLSLAFLLAAHASDALGLGSKEDPLGYFAKAKRKARQQPC